MISLKFPLGIVILLVRLEQNSQASIHGELLLEHSMIFSNKGKFFSGPEGRLICAVAEGFARGDEIENKETILISYTT